MNDLFSPKTIISFALGAVLFGTHFVIGFTEPTAAPPSNNVPAPLHTGSGGQSKAGGLILNTGGAANGLIVQLGNVGIGTLTPIAKLDIAGDIKIGNSNVTCTAANVGSTRYNNSTDQLEYCAANSGSPAWKASGGASSLPAGFVGCYAGATIPSNTLEAYGQAVSRTTYAALFSIIGTTYGAGNGSTTFNLPDLRGRVMLGMDNMGGSAASRITSASVGGANSTTLGGVGGAETHTLTPSQAPALLLGGAYIAGINNPFVTQYSGASGAAHNNTQPWIAFKCVIGT